MVIALDTTATCRYICHADRALPEDQQTAFILKRIDARTMSGIMDRMVARDTGTNSLTINSGTAELELLRYGLDHVDNLRDANGKVIEFTTGVEGRLKPVAMAFIDRIPAPVRKEVAEAVDVFQDQDAASDG